jgi:hypothetical protein
VYYRGEDNHFHHNYSLPAREDAENGNMGFAVAISDAFAITGAFSTDQLQGSIYVARIPYFGDSPTNAPTGIAEKKSFANIVNSKQNFTFAIILLLLLGALMIVVVGILTYYCCCCCIAAPLAPLKKKKKEEEDSPYTVHSYVGYSELDDAPPMYPPVPYPMPPPYYGPQGDIKKDMKKEKIVDSATEGAVRKMFPYKVYGPRGYSEGQDAEDFQNQYDDKLAKEDTAAAAAHAARGGNVIADEEEEDVSPDNARYVEQAKNRYAQYLNTASRHTDTEDKARERYEMFRRKAEEQARSELGKDDEEA